ncbi:hypothetical protein [Rhizobium ruizarguesonis]
MATFYLATIKPEDYAGFCHILPHDLDSSYDRWLFLSITVAIYFSGELVERSPDGRVSSMTMR